MYYKQKKHSFIEKVNIRQNIKVIVFWLIKRSRYKSVRKVKKKMEFVKCEAKMYI